MAKCVSDQTALAFGQIVLARSAADVFDRLRCRRRLWSEFLADLRII